MSIWRNKKFSRYAFGMLFNSLGNSFFDLAVPLLIYNMTQSLALMGTMAILVQLPKILLGPLIGALVDRLNPRRVLFCSYFLQIFIIAALPITYYLNILTPWIVLTVGFLLNAVNLFARSANFVITPLLYKDQSVQANVAFTTVWTFSMLIGPIIGAAILPFVYPMGLILIDGLTFFIMIFSLQLVGLPHRKITSKWKFTRIYKDMAEGFRMSFGNQSLRLFVLSIALCSFATAPEITLVIYHLKSAFKFSDSYIGYFTSCAGFGLFAGTLFARYLKSKKSSNLFFIGYSMIAAGLLLLAIPSWYQIPVALLIIEAGKIMYVIGRSAIIQTHCPKEYLGRVNSTFQLVEQIIYPIGMALAVLMIESFSMYTVFVGLGVVMLLSLFVLFSSRISLNEKTGNVFSAPTSSSIGSEKR
ncbi:MFS transporter [Paenibacillus terreus]|uniref:MFS transporter n=1 Tax=Paenibacillus terreus TaxID=1387834 RepID=A0ABV5BBU2_9BACL